ncbi:MAG: histidine phosphatase family protein [Cyclobacteriaceae bacterium]|nr:phosphohistidine phosphatase [Cytophagales bacterium]HNP76163.1 histidine phosphatase family protein [Cyclobacteriaceae bacterium]
MKKTLYLVRHAKSSWDNPDLDDFDRPLNERGLRDAPRMGERLNQRDINPDIILSSEAVRALETARVLAQRLQYAERKIVTDSKLYHADEETLLHYVQRIPNEHRTAMLVGHNPGLTEFAALLVDDFEEDIPTCGIVAITFQVDAWKKVLPQTGRLKFFDYPKKK